MNRFSKNFFSLISADILRRLLGFVSVAYLARVLGKDDFGIINLGFAVLAYGMVISAAGFTTLGTRKIAQGASPEIIGQVVGNRLISTIGVLAVISFIVFAGVSSSAVSWMIVLFLCSLLPQVVFLDWFFQGKETMGVVSASRVLQSCMYLLIVLTCVGTAGDILWVAVGSICGECAASVFQYVQFRKKFPGVRIRLTPSIDYFKLSFPFAVGIILTTLAANYPPIALGILATPSDVGIYSAAGKFVYFLMMGDRVLVLLLLPASARKFHESPETFSVMLQETLRWILLLCLPIAAGCMLLSEEVIVLLYGTEYSSAALVLSVLVWYFFLTMLHTVFTSGLLGAGGEKKYGKIMSATACMYFVAVSVGAWWFGPVGAAFGVVAAEGISVVWMHRSLRRLVLLLPPGKIFRSILSVLIMASAVAVISEYGLILAVLAGIGSYTLSVVLLRVITWSDMKLFMARF